MKTRRLSARIQKQNHFWAPAQNSQFDWSTCIWYVEVWELKLSFYPFAEGIKKQVNFYTHTKTKSISIPNTKTKLISTWSLKSSQFRSPLKYQADFDAPIQKSSTFRSWHSTSSFRPQYSNQVNPDLCTEIKVNSDPPKWNQVNFYHPPHTQKSFIPTLKSSQVRSPTMKSSQFRPPTQKQVKFDPPR